MKIFSRFTKKEPRQQGFTLIELLVVIAIIGIAASVAIPSFVNMINEYRLTAQANDMISSLNLARSASVKQRYTVAIENAGGNWSNGWRIFVDRNDNDTEDGGDTLLKTYPAVGGAGITITSTNGFANYISYKPNGRASAMGSFAFCPPSNINSSRKITISGSGRMRTDKGDRSVANCP